VFVAVFGAAISAPLIRHYITTRKYALLGPPSPGKAVWHAQPLSMSWEILELCGLIIDHPKRVGPS